MKQVLFIFVLFGILASSCKSMRMRGEVARNHIFTLNEGYLLVRLQTYEKKIATYNEIGMPEKAKEAEEFRDKRNRLIVDAFEEKFDFCPVLYFYSNHSSDIKEGRFDGNLLDKSLNPAKIPNNLFLDNWLMAEFAKNQDPISDGIQNATTGTRALIIKDRNLKQVERPFPKYVHHKIGDDEIYGKVVNVMNYALKNFNQAAKIKEAKLEWKRKNKAARGNG